MKKTLLCLVALALMIAAVASGENLTATGTVVSLSDDMLIIDTAAGQKTFILGPSVLKPSDLAVNARVNVAYVDENGQWVASQISPSTSSSSLASAATQPEPALESTSPALGTDDSADELPATASKLPAPALLLVGIASLLGAVVLRRLR